MDKADERKYMNTFAGTLCEACGRNDGTIVAAHFNGITGGTGYRVKGVVAGLCATCHDLVDRRGNWTNEARTKVVEQ